MELQRNLIIKSHSEIRKNSYWEFLPVFEKRKGVFKGEKELEEKPEFRRDLSSVRKIQYAESTVNVSERLMMSIEQT